MNITGQQMMNELKEAGLIEGDPEEVWNSTPNGEIGQWIALYQYALAKLPKPENPILGDLWRDGDELKCWDGKKWFSYK